MAQAASLRDSRCGFDCSLSSLFWRYGIPLVLVTVTCGSSLLEGAQLQLAAGWHLPDDGGCRAEHPFGVVLRCVSVALAPFLPASCIAFR